MKCRPLRRVLILLDRRVYQWLEAVDRFVGVGAQARFINLAAEVDKGVEGVVEVVHREVVSMQQHNPTALRDRLVSNELGRKIRSAVHRAMAARDLGAEDKVVKGRTVLVGMYHNCCCIAMVGFHMFC
jgi:hypothetical protein